MINPPSRNRFNIPNIPGAATGGVIGVGLGATLGLAKGLDNAAQEEEGQLRQVQSIADLYARKQAWDLHTSDTSTLGRHVNKVVKGGTGAIAGGLAVGTGGALLGAAGVAGYRGLKKLGAFSFNFGFKPINPALAGAGIGAVAGGALLGKAVNDYRDPRASNAEHAKDVVGGVVAGGLVGGYVGGRAGATVKDIADIASTVKRKVQTRGMSTQGIPYEDTLNAINVKSVEIPTKGQFGKEANASAALGAVGGAIVGGSIANKFRDSRDDDRDHAYSVLTAGSLGALGGAYVGGKLLSKKPAGVRFNSPLASFEIPANGLRGAVLGGFSTGALIGSGLGAVKGSLDQPERQRINPDGSITPDRYSPVERVAVVGANAGAGAGIGAVVSNIPGKAIGNAVGNAKANVKAKLRNIYTRAGKYVE